MVGKIAVEIRSTDGSIAGWPLRGKVLTVYVGTYVGTGKHGRFEKYLEIRR